MLLRDWCKLADILPTHPTTERQAVSLLSDSRNPHHSDLWALDDYKVSTVSGPVVWLVPCQSGSLVQRECYTKQPLILIVDDAPEGWDHV